MDYLGSVFPPLTAYLRGLPTWFRGSYLYRLLLVPLAGLTIVFILADNNIWGWRDPGTCKAFMEILHPGLLLAGILIAVAGWILSREPTLAFLSVLLGFVLFREIAGQGTSFVLYAGLIALIVWKQKHPEKLDSLLSSHLLTSLIATAFICYAISQLLDRGVIKRIGWLVTWDTTWSPPYSTQLEESLESLGGAFLLSASVFLIIRVWRKHSPDTESRR